MLWITSVCQHVVNGLLVFVITILTQVSQVVNYVLRASSASLSSTNPLQSVNQ